MVDLHTHSTASDGQLTPTELVALAKTQGLDVLALTDHDTVGGLAEAEAACRQSGIVFVPGIEIEVHVDRGEFHLLGLGLILDSPALSEVLTSLQEKRAARNRRIVAKMQESGIKVDYEDIEPLAKGGQIGRPHFARFLVDHGVVETIQDAFDHFLGRGLAFYEPKAALDFPAAVSWIHAVGGLAVVAHPLSLQLSLTLLEERLTQWKGEGLDGIEAWHPGAAPRQCRRLETLARRLGLKISAGSDFHGAHRPGRNLGLTSGGRRIERSIYEELFA